MTNKALVVGQTTSLLTSDVESAIKEMTRKIIKLAPGASRLNSGQAVELAVYCFMNDLNPFNGEAYYAAEMNTIIPGIQGYRRKANEELERIGDSTDRFWCEFPEAQPGEGEFDQGDIAYKAVLHDSITQKKWHDRLIQFYLELREGGVQDAWQEAKLIVGPEPTWEAVGVVRKSENFGKTDRWDRHERAKKRAEKWAIRKRFQRVLFPDPEAGEQVILDAEFVDSVVHDIDSEPPKQIRPPAEVMAELGFDVQEKPMRKWPTDLVDQLVADGLANHPNHARNILNNSPFFDDTDLDYDEVIGWVAHRKDDEATTGEGGE